MMRALTLLSAFGALATGALAAQAPSTPAPAFNVDAAAMQARGGQ